MSDFIGHASTDLAMQFLREGKLRESIGCAEKVISANPEDAKAYTILGAAYAKAGDQGMSIAAFEHALAIEPGARAHFNLGMAYEKSDRLREALEQYQLAVQADPLYRQAAEAVNRLLKTTSNEPVQQSHDRGTEAHLLTGEEETANPPPLIQDDYQHPPPPTPPPQIPPQPGTDDQTTQQFKAPQMLSADDDPNAVTIIGGPPQPAVQGLQPVGVSVAPPPQPQRLPDLSDLEARARKNEAKVRAAQKAMMKAGVIYGAISGAILMALLTLLLMVAMPWLLLSNALFGLIIWGAIIGALVGFWIGFTCGDDWTGAKAGAVIGAVAALLSSLRNISEYSFGVVLIFMFFYAFLYGFLGLLIGRFVETSIGD